MSTPIALDKRFTLDEKFTRSVGRTYVSAPVQVAARDWQAGLPQLRTWGRGGHI